MTTATTAAANSRGRRGPALRAHDRKAHLLHLLLADPGGDRLDVGVGGDGDASGRPVLRDQRRQLGERRPAARRPVDPDRAARESHARLRRRRVLDGNEDVEVLARRAAGRARSGRAASAVSPWRCLPTPRAPSATANVRVDLAGGAEVHPMGAGVDDDGGFGGAQARGRGRGRGRGREEQEEQMARGGWGTAWVGPFRNRRCHRVGARKPACFARFSAGGGPLARAGGRQTVNSFDGGG